MRQGGCCHACQGGRCGVSEACASWTIDSRKPSQHASHRLLLSRLDISRTGPPRPDRAKTPRLPLELSSIDLRKRQPLTSNNQKSEETPTSSRRTISHRIAPHPAVRYLTKRLRLLFFSRQPSPHPEHVHLRLVRHHSATAPAVSPSRRAVSHRASTGLPPPTPRAPGRLLLSTEVLP